MGRRVFKDFIYDLVNDLDIDLDNNVLEAIFEADESNQVDLIEQYVNYEVSKSAEFNDILMKLNVTIAEGVHFHMKKTKKKRMLLQLLVQILVVKLTKVKMENPKTKRITIMKKTKTK